jgi:hypothetical protein
LKIHERKEIFVMGKSFQNNYGYTGLRNIRPPSEDRLPEPMGIDPGWLGMFKHPTYTMKELAAGLADAGLHAIKTGLKIGGVALGVIGVAMAVDALTDKEEACEQCGGSGNHLIFGGVTMACQSCKGTGRVQA